jgi:hypothetical protein
MKLIHQFPKFNFYFFIFACFPINLKLITMYLNILVELLKNAFGLLWDNTLI